MATKLATPTLNIRYDSNFHHKVEYRFRLNLMITPINASVTSRFPWVFFNDVFQLQMINDLAVELPWSKFRDGRRATCKRDAYRLWAKTECICVQALRLCTGRTAHRGSRGIALPFHDGTRKGWVVSVTPRPLSTPGKVPVPIVQEAGWAPGPVWTGAENLVPTGIRSPDRPARSQSLYRLSYPAHAGAITNDSVNWRAVKKACNVRRIISVLICIVSKVTVEPHSAECNVRVPRLVFVTVLCWLFMKYNLQVRRPRCAV